MEKSTKLIIGIVVLGVLLPLAIILPLTSHKDYEDQNIAGIRDYKAGHYEIATQELNAYLKVHPDTFRSHMHLYGMSDYAEKYLGLALLKQHRYAEAVNTFRVYANYSDDGEGNYLLGTALFRNGNKIEARSKFNEVIQSEMSKGMSTRNESLVKLSNNMLEEIDHSR